MPASPKRVLIVDDDREICQILKTKLQVHAFEVSTAFEGSEAYQMTVQTFPDLILLDIRMPAGEDGLTFLRRLRGCRHDDLELESRIRKTPVIVLTGAGDLMRPLFEMEGISDFVPKSESMDHIRDRVLKVLPLE